MRSVAAGEAESLVLAQMQAIFRAPEIAAQVIVAAAKLDGIVEGGGLAARERAIVEALGSLDAIWAELFPAEQQRLLHLLIERITVEPDGFRIALRADGLRSLALEMRDGEATAMGAAA